MLRPKKHITRKEIRRDPLLETVDQAQAHIEQNKSTYMKVAVGVIGMLIVFNITVGKRTQRDIDASASLGQALISLDRNDLNTAQFQLETINDEFTGTNSGDISEYYLGKIQYESGELIDAEKYLQDFLKKDSAPYLHIPAILMLIDIELNKNNLTEAIGLVDKGIRVCEDIHNLRTLKLKKAQLSFMNGDKDISRKIIDEILKDKNLGSNHRLMAEEIFGKLVG